MDTHRRGRFRLEVTLAALSAALFLLTLVFPEWIEATTGLEPDGGSGALEFAISGALALVAIGAALLARRDHSRLALEKGLTVSSARSDIQQGTSA